MNQKVLWLYFVILVFANGYTFVTWPQITDYFLGTFFMLRASWGVGYLGKKTLKRNF